MYSCNLLSRSSISGSHAASIVQGPNGLQPTIKIENSGNSYYSNCYTPPAPDHSVLMGSGTYSEFEDFI